MQKLARRNSKKRRNPGFHRKSEEIFLKIAPLFKNWHRILAYASAVKNMIVFSYRTLFMQILLHVHVFMKNDRFHGKSWFLKPKTVLFCHFH